VEGAALAVAIIGEARARGARVAATTHYAELKTFAMTTAGVENASCEFDVETLAPTYRLLIGIPGKSNAFAISKRLGLSERVIESAKAQMSGESVRFEDVLTQLEQKRQALEKEKEEADRLLARREEDARKAREFREQMERAKDNARSRGEAEAKRILADAKAAADAAFRALDALKKEQKKLEAQQVNETRADILRSLNDAREKLGAHDNFREPVPKPSRPIAAGDLVEIPGTGRRAEVLAVNGGTLECRAGALRMKVKADEVRLIEDDERAALAPKTAPRAGSRVIRSASAPRELDIRGMETLEAESVVESYIDAAVVAHLETVTIIHGKGTGALRKAVHALLKRNKSVKAFRLGAFGEGEAGVTVVTLR
jgi:DNA mismatch repair protein MutS2